MKKFLFSILFLIANALFSNPVWLYEIDEFQVAPDSLEKIELIWNGYNWGETLDGYMVITLEDTAFIDSGVYPDSSGYIVLSEANTSGIFNLNDIHDSVSIIKTSGVYEGMPLSYYPSDIYTPTPPINTSTSFTEICIGFCQGTSGLDWCYSPDCYIDSTPTFGDNNDDYPWSAKISGKVFDENSLPITGIALCAEPPPCSGVVYFYKYDSKSGVDGGYLFDSLAPQVYIVYVKDSIYYSDTVKYIKPYALTPIENLNFYLKKFGINENSYSEAKTFKILSNPTRTGTYIEFSTIKSTLVKLSVYNISGSLVRKLLNENKPSGKHKIYWDATTESGSRLRPGIYFCRLKAGNKTFTKKLILI